METRTFGESLRAIRKDRKLTQNQLAEASGVSRSTIVLIEKGQITNSTITTLQDLAQALDVTAAELLGGRAG